MRLTLIRLILVFTGFFALSAHAALNCDQLLAVSQLAITLRDEGNSLSSVLAQIDASEMRQKLDAKEVNLVRQVARISFTSEYSPREIIEACKDGSLGIPKPKP